MCMSTPNFPKPEPPKPPAPPPPAPAPTAGSLRMGPKRQRSTQTRGKSRLLIPSPGSEYSGPSGVNM
jgi:hypothetical protein